MRSNRYAALWVICGLAVAVAACRLIGVPRGWRTLLPRRSPTPPPRGKHDGWHRTPLASLDFETTGVDPLTDRVLSYALLGDDGRDITGLINPGVPVPPLSAAVHGLTDEILAHAPDPRTGLAVVVDWIQSLIERRVGLVVFNAAYDLTMLSAEATRWGLPQPDWDRLLVVDPYVIDWGIERGRLGSRRLVDVAGYYSVRIDNAHDAACDARAARDVAYEIGARHRTVGSTTLAGLMQDQRGWFSGRAQDWNAYARTVGRSLDDPHGWPLATPPLR